MIKYNDLPCVKEKCLKFPVCKRKPIILCSTLQNFVVSERNKTCEIMSIHENIEWWNKTIKPYFSNLVSIGSQQRGKNAVIANQLFRLEHAVGRIR